MKGKRGQFYLLGAIIIVVVIIGFATIQNYTKKQSSLRLYDLKEELGIESAKVLDYGTFNIDDSQSRRNLIEDFSEKYIVYTGEGRDIYLLFGNYDEVVQIMQMVATDEGVAAGAAVVTEEGVAYEVGMATEEVVIVEEGVVVEGAAAVVDAVVTEEGAVIAGALAVSETEASEDGPTETDEANEKDE